MRQRIADYLRSKAIHWVRRARYWYDLAPTEESPARAKEQTAIAWAELLLTLAGLIEGEHKDERGEV
jgi:hypothetical protein